MSHYFYHFGEQNIPDSYLGLNEIKKGFLAQTKQAKRNVKVLNAILKSKD